MTEKIPENQKRKRGRPPKPQPPSFHAQNEIDKRLAQAITDRAEAMKMCSKYAYWQDRLARVSQEINELIGYQQRLSGQGTRLAAPIDLPPINLMPTPYNPIAPIPDGVGSIPALPRQPKPTTPNVADIAGEGGFS